MPRAIVTAAIATAILSLAACAAPPVGESPARDVDEGAERDEQPAAKTTAREPAPDLDEPVAREVDAGPVTSEEAAVDAGSPVDAAPAPAPRHDAGLEPKPSSHASGTCVYGDGLYCGGNGVTGHPKTLYRCVRGVVTPVCACETTCKREAPGVNDHCS